jgi:PST family polysaccharide transporter
VLRDVFSSQRNKHWFKDETFRGLMRIRGVHKEMSTELASVPSRRIATRASTGAIILIALRLATRAIDFLALVVLGRLLSPADFGLVAIAMSVMMIVEAVTEFPVGYALVAFPTRTKDHYDTAFTLMLIRGLILALALLILAWPLAQFYGDHRLFGLMLALGLAPTSRGLVSPRVVEFSMSFDFRPNFVMEVTGKLLALVLSVAFAWWTKSYWSLAVGTVAAPMTTAIVSYLYAPFPPALTIKEWRDFSGFLGWLTVTQAVTALNWQMDQLLLGRFVSRFELGRFSMAGNLANIPWQIFIVQVLSPLLVGFSLVRDDLSRLRAAYQKSANTIVSVGLPVMVGMSMNAEPIIRLILGDQWLDAAAILRWLSLVTIPPLFVAPLGPLSMTLNRTSILSRLALIEASYRLPLTLVAIYTYGIQGALFSRMVTSTVVTGCSMHAARELVKLSFRQQIMGPWRPMLSALIMALSIAPLEGIPKASDHFLPMLMALMFVSAVGACVYVASIILLWSLAGYPSGLESDLFRLLGNSSRKVLDRSRRFITGTRTER